MSVTISDQDYKEYQIMLHNVVRQHKLDSVRGLNNLKDDIDIPIRNIIVMLALLGCEPMWSCCGFDYDGQPIHKTHEYGGIYIMLRDTTQANKIVFELMDKGVVFERNDKTDKWTTWKFQGAIYLKSNFNYFHKKTEYPWTMTSCLHYPELAMFKIKELEDILYSARESFNFEATISDTNIRYKDRFPNWQYPVLEDWIITLDDVKVKK